MEPSTSADNNISKEEVSDPRPGAGEKRENPVMIPSSPRRTWIFLLVSCALFFGPDLVIPESWAHNLLYERMSAAYQGILVVIGFWFGPSICRALVIRTLSIGPLRASIDQALVELKGLGMALPPVTLAEHAIPFVFTVGLLPRRCEVFLSSGLAQQLSENGVRFLLAHAATHATWPQRMVDMLPILAFTILTPNDMHLSSTWPILGASLAAWLGMHWLFELDADRRAGKALGGEAAGALREVNAANRSPLERLVPHPPFSWRLRAAGAGRDRLDVTKPS